MTLKQINRMLNQYASLAAIEFKQLSHGFANDVNASEQSDINHDYYYSHKNTSPFPTTSLRVH